MAHKNVRFLIYKILKDLLGKTFPFDEILGFSVNGTRATLLDAFHVVDGRLGLFTVAAIAATRATATIVVVNHF